MIKLQSLTCTLIAVFFSSSAECSAQTSTTQLESHSSRWKLYDGWTKEPDRQPSFGCSVGLNPSLVHRPYPADEQCNTADILVTKSKPPVMATKKDPMSVEPWTYGWEFFGLTKEELERKVESINLAVSPKWHIYNLNQERTRLFSGASLAGRSWDFDYRDGRIATVRKGSYGGLEQYQGKMESQSQAFSLAISDYTRLMAQAQKRLDKFLIGDYPNPFGASKERLIDMYFGEVQSWYIQRAIVYEKNGQHELSQADYLVAKQLYEREQSAQGK